MNINNMIKFLWVKMQKDNNLNQMYLNKNSKKINQANQIQSMKLN